MNVSNKVALAAIALALSGCSVSGQAVYPSADEIQLDVAVWRSDARADLTKVSNNLDVVSKAAYANDVVAVSEACTAWGESLNGAYKWYVSPKGAASVEIRAAFEDWKKSAAECALIGGDYDQAAKWMESGTEHLNNATAILDGKVEG